MNIFFEQNSTLRLRRWCVLLSWLMKVRVGTRHLHPSALAGWGSPVSSSGGPICPRLPVTGCTRITGS